MRGKKKGLLICIYIVVLLCLSTGVYAKDNLKDNDLEIKSDRLERGTTASDHTIINNENLFYESANKKIKEYKEKENIEKIKAKETLFTQGTINVAVYDTNTVFGEEVLQKYTQEAVANTAGDRDSIQNAGVLVSVVGCLFVIAIGSVTSYKSFKKG